MQDIIQDFQQQASPLLEQPKPEEASAWQERQCPAFHAAEHPADINDDCCHICGLQVHLSPGLIMHVCSCDCAQNLQLQKICISRTAKGRSNLAAQAGIYIWHYRPYANLLSFWHAELHNNTSWCEGNLLIAIIYKRAYLQSSGPSCCKQTYLNIVFRVCFTSGCTSTLPQLIPIWACAGGPALLRRLSCSSACSMPGSDDSTSGGLVLPAVHLPSLRLCCLWSGIPSSLPGTALANSCSPDCQQMAQSAHDACTFQTGG